MRKTSVYLTDEEAEALRTAAAATGRSQSDLIRDGIRRAVESAGRPQRVFRAMGVGHGGGGPFTHWDPDELYEHVMGRSKWR